MSMKIISFLRIAIPLVSIALLVVFTLVKSDGVQGKIDSTDFDSHIDKDYLTSSNNSQVAYSLIIRNRTPKIQAGDILEIEAIISGYGIPVKNKMNIFWSSPYVIDIDNPGYYKGDYPPKTVGIDPNGVIIGFSADFFLDSPLTSPNPDFRFPLMIGETFINGEPPLLFFLNTSKTAPPGDYEIAFVFTYSDGQNIFQDYKTTQFHINSRWEIYQPWITGFGVGIAFISLVTTTIVGILNLKINKSRKRQYIIPS
jgi:hypothetical protein